MAYLMDSGRPREPFLVAPSCVLWLIGAILATHAVRVMLPGEWPDLLVNAFAFIPARYSVTQDLTADSVFFLAIPFVSHIFLHAGWAHAIVNSLWLLAFGPLAARQLGTPMFLLFFLFCGIAGVLAQLLIYWGSQDAVVGASGAISGLMGASIRMVYGRGLDMPLAPLFSGQMLTFSLMWLAVNALTGIVGFGAGDDFALVAWAVHLGGYFAGVLSIPLFLAASVSRGP